MTDRDCGAPTTPAADTDAPTRSVELPQGRVRYRDVGSGPPIVLVHGLLVNGLLWRKVVPRLARDARCIVPDLPLGGHDPAMRPDADLTPPGLARLIADLLDALELDDVTLVGNDTGGAICQLVVTRHPERIGRLVLTNCDAWDNFLPPMFRPLQWIARVPGGVWVALQPMRLAPVRGLPIGFGLVIKHRTPAQERAYLEPAWRSRGVRRDAAKVLKGISRRYTNEAAARFGEFDRPVLIVWAPEDRAFTVDYGERLAQAFPNARLEMVEDSLTFISEDQPERLAELVGAFVAKRVAPS